MSPGTTARKAAPLALLLYVLALYGATAALQHGLFERDGFYHARVSQLLHERWFSRDFPWTQLSTWKDGYCDKEVLFHVAMAPFTSLAGSAIGGARVFIVLLSATVVALLWWVLRAHGVPWPTFFAAFPLATGGLFIARLNMIRSHVLSMALVILGAHLLAQKRWRALVLLGFAYAWCYTVPFVLFMTAAPFVVGAWLARGGFDWRSPAAALGGATLGLLVHPYSPLTLETFLTYVQVFKIGMQGVGGSGLELGNEIYPYPLPVLWDIYPLLLLVAAALPLVVLARFRRLGPGAVGMSAAATFWMAMTVAAPRFVEYGVLLLALAVGFVVRDLVRAEGPGAHEAGWARHPRWRWAIAAAALAVLAGFHYRSLTFFKHYQTKAAPARFYDGAAAWMQEHLKAGETVINLYWDDFPDLFYSAPRQTYLWGLDPTYSLRFDEPRTMALERARRRVGGPVDGKLLRELFGTPWLVLRASRAPGYPELSAPPFTRVYKDASAVIYRID